MKAVLRWADGIVGASRWAAFPSPSLLADANASDSFTARLLTPRVATSPSSAHTVAHRGLGTERIFDEMRRDIEPRLGAGGDLNPVQAYAGKLAGDVVRVAAVFTLLADSRAERIPADAMRAAVASGWWMLAHTRYALGDAGLSEDERDARKLLATFRRRGSRAFSERDAKRALDHKGTDSPPALTVLDEMGWTRLATPPRPPVGKDKGGRPPGPIREVNPKLFDG